MAPTFPFGSKLPQNFYDKKALSNGKYTKPTVILSANTIGTHSSLFDFKRLYKIVYNNDYLCENSNFFNYWSFLNLS